MCAAVGPLVLVYSVGEYSHIHSFRPTNAPSPAVRTRVPAISRLPHGAPSPHRPRPTARRWPTCHRAQVARVAQWRVFGPLTGQPLRGLGLEGVMRRLGEAGWFGAGAGGGGGGGGSHLSAAAAAAASNAAAHGADLPSFSLAQWQALQVCTTAVTLLLLPLLPRCARRTRAPPPCRFLLASPILSPRLCVRTPMQHVPISSHLVVGGSHAACAFSPAPCFRSLAPAPATNCSRRPLHAPQRHCDTT